MATVLENYRQFQQKLEQDTNISAVALWQYSELSYRISVLKTCQMYCKSAPRTNQMPTLVGHYKMLDAYIQSISLDRRYGPDHGPDTAKERNAAQINLDRVVQDYRKRFSSFSPSTEEAYSQEIGKLVGVLLPAWLQFRETFIPLRQK